MINKNLIERMDRNKNRINQIRLSNIEKSDLLNQYARAEFIQSSMEINEDAALLAYEKAYDSILEAAGQENLIINEDMIRQMYTSLIEGTDLIQTGSYRITTADTLGIKAIPPSAEEIDSLISHFIHQIETSKMMFHPIEFAAMCHKRIIDIQPFPIGNGHIARLLMNLILVQEGYGVVIIPPRAREEYFNAIIASRRPNTPDIDTLLQFIAKSMIDTQESYIKILDR